MASISIRIDKTTKTIGSRIDDRLITDEMSEKITEICNLLFDDSNEFKEEKAFAKIFQYIKEHKRLLYSQISNEVYACFNERTTEEASNKLGTMISNIEKVVAYTGTQRYNEKRRKKNRLITKRYMKIQKKLLLKYGIM